MITLLHTPQNTELKDEIYVWMSVEGTGEGILAASIDGLGWTTLVTGKYELAMKMEPLAKELGRLGNKRVQLVKFTSKTVLKTLDETANSKMPDSSRPNRK